MSEPLSPIEQQVLQAIRGLRYGTVEITVHDSRVVQIERREKVRVQEPPLPGRRSTGD